VERSTGSAAAAARNPKPMLLMPNQAVVMMLARELRAMIDAMQIGQMAHDQLIAVLVFY
jgi:hypothetical protein